MMTIYLFSFCWFLISFLAIYNENCYLLLHIDHLVEVVHLYKTILYSRASRTFHSHPHTILELQIQILILILYFDAISNMYTFEVFSMLSLMNTYHSQLNSDRIHILIESKNQHYCPPDTYLHISSSSNSMPIVPQMKSRGCKFHDDMFRYYHKARMPLQKVRIVHRTSYPCNLAKVDEIGGIYFLQIGHIIKKKIFRK